MSTLRTLLVAIHDENEFVKKTIEKEIVDKFSISAVVFYYSESPHKNALMISLKNLMEKNLKLKPHTLTYLKDLYNSFGKECDEEKFGYNSVNKEENNKK